MATATTTEIGVPHLRAHDLACRRGGRTLFAHLNLCVRPGEAWWIRGPNGQGKTSLLRLLAGLSSPAHGEVERHAPLSYIGHQLALKDELNALEALAVLSRLHGLAHDPLSLNAALDAVGVKGRRKAPVRTLSQGQRRRVALARLVLAAPGGLWVLDEPFDALDDQGQQLLRELIQSHRQQRGSVVLTSHQSHTLPDVAKLELDDGARS